MAFPVRLSVLPKNVGDLVAAGATTLVAGSSILGQKDRAAALAKLRSAAIAGETP